ncbi:hypothetical protein [Actinomyces sp.]|uniref:hypothetical protein n=1 Tax=Actinomyces sp. TaxID=29317 RepID=UPI00289A368F|nr:hypothetical protein [Actinomyces sp.]
MGDVHGVPPAHPDAGRISVLVIGLTALLLAVVLVLAAITVVHVQDRRLLTCADRVAAAASAVMDADAYYGADGGPRRLLPAPGAASAEAGSTLALLSTTSCSVGGGVALLGVEATAGGVTVTVSATATLPLLPPVLGDVVAPTLVATSSATTR